jgi:hypothetical protein
VAATPNVPTSSVLVDVVADAAVDDVEAGAVAAKLAGKANGFIAPAEPSP